MAVGVPTETHQRHHAVRKHAETRLRSAAECASAPGATCCGLAVHHLENAQRRPSGACRTFTPSMSLSSCDCLVVAWQVSGCCVASGDSKLANTGVRASESWCFAFSLGVTFAFIAAHAQMNSCRQKSRRCRRPTRYTRAPGRCLEGQPPKLLP